MSVACFRARKRVAHMVDFARRADDGSAEAAFVTALDIIDEELEAEAERLYTQPLNPDPATQMARDLKESK
jgi:hypothetical protein